MRKLLDRLLTLLRLRHRPTLAERERGRDGLFIGLSIIPTKREPRR